MALTVVIPSRDAGPRLRSCLEALGRQRGGDGRFDVVVVDDGSRPPIAELPSTVGPAPLRLIRREAPGGIAVARNEGWRAASGEICLFLDDDIIADPRLVAGHLDAHRAARARGATIVGIGRLVTRVPANADGLAKRFAASWGSHVRAMDAGRPPRATDGYGGDLSIPLERLQATDGFDEAFARSEDVELVARLVDSGSELVWVHGESVHHERKSGPDMLRDAARNGAVAPDLLARHPWLLPETEAGSYAAFGQRQTLVRRLLTRRAIDHRRLARLAPLIPAGRATGRGVTTLAHLAHWSGVRTNVDDTTFQRMTDGTAILMYHGFAPSGERGSRYVVPADRFERQLRGLLQRGHVPLSLDAYLDARRRFAFPPARSFVVTIDDGYRDVGEIAAPILRRLGIPATLFVVADRIGQRNDWDAQAPMHGRQLLDEDGLDRLRGDGIAFGAHAGSHLRLVDLSPDRLDEEVGGAVERLRARVGDLVPAFAYPYGVADDAARAAVERIGMAGLGVREGLACPASPGLALPRIEVHGTDGPWRVALAARLGGTRRLLRP